MSNSKNSQYKQIASILEIVQVNPNEFHWDEVSEKTGLTTLQIQQLFKEWAGVDEKQFLEYIHVRHAQKILKETQPTLFDTVEEVKKMKHARIHESFVEIEVMDTNNFKKKEKPTIEYSLNETIFGELLIASTKHGICYLGFTNDLQNNFSALEDRFPKANFLQQKNEMHQNVLLIFTPDWADVKKIKLHLLGTDFQMQVWKKLLQIPTGDLTTYGTLATQIHKPKAARAVGTAIGNNPIAFLIPCHRVIQTSGALGGYRWGNTRKIAMIGWEASQK